MSLTESHARHDWAYRTFSSLDVGSRRRTRRVVAMAAAVAEHPAGAVTDVFSDSADREGAYRLLSNELVPSAELTRAMCEATAEDCADFDRVYVPVDGSSLSLPDGKRGREVGGLGSWGKGGRGLHCVTALAIDPKGTPIGVCAQRWWAREERSKVDRRSDRTPLEDKETRHLVTTIQDAHERLEVCASSTRAVFVLDRGFDCWPILQLAGCGVGLILRAEHTRRLVPVQPGDPKYLKDALGEARVLGHYSVEVPARDNRPARIARMEVRATKVTIELRIDRKQREQVTLNAVRAREIGGPKGASLHWMLLTTEPIDTFADAIAVVHGYALRWRIEELHRVWKRGGCDVEDTWLRSREGIIKWATLHCAVATRALRLTHLARTAPDTPALEEFTQDEIDGAIVLRRQRTKLKLGATPTVHEVVDMIACLGGYTGKSSGGPPGPTVIARGLEKIAVAAQVVASMRGK
ncbi:MAG: IS4 family transposase [Polyangiales bacterium]